MATPRRHTVEGLAAALGCCSRTLRNYSNKQYNHHEYRVAPPVSGRRVVATDDFQIIETALAIIKSEKGRSKA